MSKAYKMLQIPVTKEEYDKRLKRIIDDGVLDPKISWWEDGLNEMGSDG